MDADWELLLEQKRIEIDTLRSVLTKAGEALDRLSRLGNEPHLGNSTGNRIAQAALQEINQVLKHEGNPSEELEYLRQFFYLTREIVGAIRAGGLPEDSEMFLDPLVRKIDGYQNIKPA